MALHAGLASLAGLAGSPLYEDLDAGAAQAARLLTPAPQAAASTR